MTSLVLSADSLLRESTRLGPVLGIDTGGPEASLGIVAEGQVRSQLTRSFTSHCAGLPTAVDEMLGMVGLQIADLAGIAIGIGPGSFTGLRVGLSYAKGLASARGLPIAGVPSMDAMALCAEPRFTPGMLVCPIIDARRDEVYAALYRFSGDALERITGDMVAPLTELVSQIVGEAIFIGGEKAAEARALAEAQGCSANAHVTLEQRGSWVAAIGAARIAHADHDRIATLEPLYVRAPGVALKEGGPP